jgi:hypothetical protein
LQRKKRCFSTEEIAAAQAINSINYQSIKENREYAGFIVRNPDGSYSYTDPAPLGESGGQLRKAPGTVALYHTHGAPTPGAEKFSYKDIFAATEIVKGNSYLGTPRGVIKKFDWKTWEITNLPYPKPKEGECPCQ